MQLLVSPCSIEEAKNSLAADIIDVKNPAEGSLGANFPWIIRGIKNLADKSISAAIGDYDYKPGNAALAAYGAACAGADYIKVGLLFNGEEKAITFIQAVVRSVKECFPEKFVVIAAYADYKRLNSISPLTLPHIVAELGADVMMIDTGIKDGNGLFDFMTSEVLQDFTERNRGLGLRTALAGSLKFEDIPTLKKVNPDVIGVRGMVCGGNRSNEIQAELVEKAMKMIR